jgi:type II secretory pathway pseudopilin PulG
MQTPKSLALFILAIAMAVPSFVLAQGGASGKAEQQVLQAEKDRFAAMQKADDAALNKLLADELTYTHSNANMQTKPQFVADIKSGAIKYVSIVPSESDWKVRIFGNVAIVSGVAAVNVIDHGNNLKFKIRYTNDHINRAGSWQMVNWQSTRFPQ